MMVLATAFESSVFKLLDLQQPLISQVHFDVTLDVWIMCKCFFWTDCNL